VLRESKDSVDQIYAFYEQAFSTAHGKCSFRRARGRSREFNLQLPDYLT
jgi:hypothetical protein